VGYIWLAKFVNDGLPNTINDEAMVKAQIKRLMPFFLRGGLRTILQIPCPLIVLEKEKV
jgi:hypothetical protein